MITKVYDYVKKYHMIESGDMIVAGISGGADSVCLLFMLLEIRKKIDFKLAVVHVNHGIRKEAGEDAEYVRGLCTEKKLPFYLTEADVKTYAAEKGLSEEEAGREIRYLAFEEALRKEYVSDCEAKRIDLEKSLPPKAKIAVAHNNNDRAETILFNLFRGTGIKGLAGIRPVNGRIIRPILCMERKEIEGWLSEKGITYCNDCTNEQDIYTRNRIRHHILPFAEKEVCRGAVSHISKAGEHLLETTDFIERQTMQARERCCKKGFDDEVKICISALKQEDEYLQRQILLSALEQISPGRKDITFAHINNMEQLLDKDGSKEIHLPYGIVVCKEYDMVTIRRKASVKDETEKQNLTDWGQEKYLPNESGKMDVPGLGTVEFAIFSYEKSKNIPQKTYTKWFDYDKINQSVLFRKREPGDYLTINSSMNRKSLQDYLVNQKIPKARRDEMYILADAAHIMWVPGYRISEYYKVTEDTRRVLQVTVNELFT